MQLSEITVKGLLVQQIRNDIIRGHLVPGARLPLRELAEKYEVSTQPIRQALSELEAEGLVHTQPRKGSMVAVLSAAELRDIYEIRSSLEAMATRSAVEMISPQTITTLRELITAMDDHLGEVVELVSLNKKFHLTLYEQSGRTTLCDLISSLRNRTSHYLHGYMIDLGGMPPAQDEHRAVIAACEKGDGVAAAEIMYRHVMKAGEGIIAYVEREKLAGAGS